jgi:molybdenum cofactor synthesis domain-containing protein
VTTESFDLLNKQELKFLDVTLRDANLQLFGQTVAGVLDLSPNEVLVTDVLPGVVTIDVLVSSIEAHQLLGRSEVLLDRLRALPGVHVGPEACLESKGVLGWIAAQEAEFGPALEVARRTATEIAERIRRRARVFSTGDEVIAGAIEDTNRLTLERELGAAGLTVEFGGILPDDVDIAIGRLRRAVDAGFGLIVTTGGVGAESKDHSVEAVLALDRSAATPYLVHFEPGHGRHVKDGIRIAVGDHLGTRIVALPGPNEEVEMVAPILRAAYTAGESKDAMATVIAERLRTHLRERMGHHDPHNHPSDHIGDHP